MPVPSGKDSFTFALTSSLKASPFAITVDGTTTTVTPYPVSIPVETTTTTVPINIILPTTVFTSNGFTQTFSEAQITSLAKISTTTTVTTSFVESAPGTSSSTTSTTIVPLWVTIGGFYWSPMPEPTLPPFRIPSIPSFPPVPFPPCFKLFDIFSIDCPPTDIRDRQQQPSVAAPLHQPAQGVAGLSVQPTAALMGLPRRRPSPRQARVALKRSLRAVLCVPPHPASLLAPPIWAANARLPL